MLEIGFLFCLRQVVLGRTLKPVFALTVQVKWEEYNSLLDIYTFPVPFLKIANGVVANVPHHAAGLSAWRLPVSTAD